MEVFQYCTKTISWNHLFFQSGSCLLIRPDLHLYAELEISCCCFYLHYTTLHYNGADQQYITMLQPRLLLYTGFTIHLLTYVIFFLSLKFCQDIIFCVIIIKCLFNQKTLLFLFLQKVVVTDNTNMNTCTYCMSYRESMIFSEKVIVP